MQWVTVHFSMSGLAPKKAKDKRAYTSILYGNGPGYSIRDGGRPAVSLPAVGRIVLEEKEWGGAFLGFTGAGTAPTPGWWELLHAKGRRAAPSTISPTLSTEDKDYRQQAAVPLDLETHSGEDVVVLAQGPMAHLFHGVQEQHYIAHAIAYAACLKPYDARPRCAAPRRASGSSQRSPQPLLALLALCMSAFMVVG